MWELIMYDSVHLQSGLLNDPEYTILIYFRRFPWETVMWQLQQESWVFIGEDEVKGNIADDKPTLEAYEEEETATCGF